MNYEERPDLWHTRLLLVQTQGSNWVIATPDHDIYVEEMAATNSDFTGFYYSGPNGHVPAHINPAMVLLPSPRLNLDNFRCKGGWWLGTWE